MYRYRKENSVFSVDNLVNQGVLFSIRSVAKQTCFKWIIYFFSHKNETLPDILPFSEYFRLTNFSYGPSLYTKLLFLPFIAYLPTVSESSRGENSIMVPFYGCEVTSYEYLRITS